MAGRIFVTGGSGFVGHAVIDELLSRGHSVNALTHRKSLDFPPDRVKPIEGSVLNPNAIATGLRDATAVIHLVGIIDERPASGITFEAMHTQATKNVVDAAVAANVRRYIQMSALGARPNAPARYHATKFAAEQFVRNSNLDWTIFRPSLIHGPRGEFMRMERKWARRLAPPFLFMPYFGKGPFGRGGAGLLQPVYVKDVARAFVDALEKPATIHEIYPLGGPDQMTWPQLHRTVATALVGKPRRVLAMPVPVALTITALKLGRLFGFNRDQVLMSQENATADMSKFKDDFGWETQPFESTLTSYAKDM